MNHLATSAAPRVLFSSRMRSMARRTLPSMRGRKVLRPVSDIGFDSRRLYLRWTSGRISLNTLDESVMRSE